MTRNGAPALVDYAGTLDCIHCGLCLQTCPTFRLTGCETSSPRGRVHLMRAVGEQRAEPDADYADELDFCLLCRRCESVCPAGVRFGEMMEEARFAREDILPRALPARLARWLGLRVVLPHRFAQRLAADGLRLLQRTGLDRLLARLGPKLGIGAARGLADLPAIEPRSARSLLPERIPAVGPSTREVYLLQGCVQADLLPEVDRSTATALAALGVHVRVPALPCCGSLHAHNGDRVGARRLAQGVIEVFEADDLPIVLNSAGCGAHLAELHHLFPPSDPWHARARAIAERVVDFSVFVAPLLADRELSIAPSLSPITWDDPCHLCHGQGVREEPRAVLQAISNAEFVPLSDPEACCGSAGIYSILRPDDAREVFEPKLASFRASGARTLVTSNPGCQLQWTSGLRRAGVADARVISLSELVAHALAEASAKPLSSGHDETHD